MFLVQENIIVQLDFLANELSGAQLLSRDLIT